jgi:hypothetical protein
MTASKSLAIVEDDSGSDGSDMLSWYYPQPKCVSPMQPPSLVSVLGNPSTSPSSTTLDSVSAQLHSLTEEVFLSFQMSLRMHLHLCQLLLLCHRHFESLALLQF